jgi:hypothetical protein
LEQLAEPIHADTWRRITFLYTTGEYLLNASSVNDLVVKSDERQLLWQALRERADQQYGNQQLPEYDIPEEILQVLLGIKEPGVSLVRMIEAFKDMMYGKFYKISVKIQSLMQLRIFKNIFGHFS